MDRPAPAQPAGSSRPLIPLDPTRAIAAIRSVDALAALTWIFPIPQSIAAGARRSTSTTGIAPSGWPAANSSPGRSGLKSSTIDHDERPIPGGSNRSRIDPIRVSTTTGTPLADPNATPLKSGARSLDGAGAGKVDPIGLREREAKDA